MRGGSVAVDLKHPVTRCKGAMCAGSPSGREPKRGGSS